MRIFLFFLLSLLVWGCSTVEVTKEVIKVTNTVTDKVKDSVLQKEGDTESIVEEIVEEKVIEEEQNTFRLYFHTISDIFPWAQKHTVLVCLASLVGQ